MVDNSIIDNSHDRPQFIEQEIRLGEKMSHLTHRANVLVQALAGLKINYSELVQLRDVMKEIVTATNENHNKSVWNKCAELEKKLYKESDKSCREAGKEPPEREILFTPVYEINEYGI